MGALLEDQELRVDGELWSDKRWLRLVPQDDHNPMIHDNGPRAVRASNTVQDFALPVIHVNDGWHGWRRVGP